MLLDVVASCCEKFETGQTFRPVQTDATLLAYNSQHCWELLRPFAHSLTIKLTNLSWLAVSLPYRLSSYGQYVIMLTTMFVTLVKVRRGRCENRKATTCLRKAPATYAKLHLL